MSDFNPPPNAPSPGAPRTRLEDALSALVDRYGLSLLNDPDALKLHLDQVCPDAPASTSQLMTALVDGVPQQLLAAHSDDDVAALLPRLVSRLGERDGFDAASARWVVRSWAHALALPAVGLDGPVPRAPAAPPPRAVDFAAIVTPRSDRKPAVPRPLVENSGTPIGPPPAVPAGGTFVRTNSDSRRGRPAPAPPPDQRPKALPAPTIVDGVGHGMSKPTAAPGPGVPAATSGRPDPEVIPGAPPPVVERAPPSPAVSIDKAPVPPAPQALPGDRAPVPPPNLEPIVAPTVSGSLGHETPKPLPVQAPPAAGPRPGIPAATSGRPEADAVPPKPATANELRAARPLGYLPPAQSGGRSGSKRRAVVLGALLVAIAVAGIVIGRNRTPQVPAPMAGAPGPAAGVAAVPVPEPSLPGPTSSAPAGVVDDRPEAAAAAVPGDPASPSAAAAPGAAGAASAPAAPAVTARAEAAPPPSAASKPPVIARIDVPRVPAGKPFSIVLVVDPSTAGNVATVERRVVESTIPWPSPVKVTPVSALGRSRSGALLYPVDGIGAASTTTMQFTLIDRKGVRSSPRRVAFRTESPAPPTVAGACARTTCGSVASVREFEPARGGARAYEVIIRMDDRTIQTAVMATRPRPGARMQKAGNQFVTVAADRR